MFSPDDPGRYRDLIGGLYEHDWFMVAADFDAYAAAQREVDALWSDPSRWWRDGDPEHRAHGLVLVRPHDPRNMRRTSGASACSLRPKPLGRERDREQGARQAQRSAESGGLDAAEVEAIVAGAHADPFAVLGLHEADGGLVARAFIDGAEAVEAFTLGRQACGQARAPPRRPGSSRAR